VPPFDPDPLELLEPLEPLPPLAWLKRVAGVELTKFLNSAATISAGRPSGTIFETITSGIGPFGWSATIVS
jgi:hypothetical protein